MELKKLMEHISITPDYRQAWKVVHKLSDILLLTICAVISGAEGWEDIEDFGARRRKAHHRARAHEKSIYLRCDPLHRGIFADFVDISHESAQHQ